VEIGIIRILRLGKPGYAAILSKLTSKIEWIIQRR
jgi:hypothetical protein